MTHYSCYPLPPCIKRPSTTLLEADYPCPSTSSTMRALRIMTASYNQPYLPHQQRQHHIQAYNQKYSSCYLLKGASLPPLYLSTNHLRLPQHQVRMSLLLPSPLAMGVIIMSHCCWRMRRGWYSALETGSLLQWWSRWSAPWMIPLGMWIYV